MFVGRGGEVWEKEDRNGEEDREKGCWRKV